MEQVVCDLCGANNSSPYLKTTDRFTGLVYTLYICNECKLVYLNPRPTRGEIEELYPKNYEAYRLLGHYNSVIANWHNKRALVKQLDYVERYRPKRGLMLDVGCATGNFLFIARERGWQVLGLEVIEKAAEIARQQLGMEVITNDLENAKLPSASLDVITLWDVMEHLPSPWGDMHRIHDLLRPGGLVYFSIPNLDSYDRTLFRSDWIGWDAPRHFTFYNNKTIQRLLAGTGFELVDRRCLLGGKGAFFLSVDRIIQKKPTLKWLQHMYPIINVFLWPFRQYAYFRRRGPIIYYTARKVKV